MEERFIASVQAEARPIEDASATTAGSAAGDAAAPRELSDPRALQILSTEHWSLLTARSLVYNEAFARGGMFLAVLSATLVALGLVSTGTGFSDSFLFVVAVVLTLDLFVGLATLGRIVGASSEDLRYLQGMNRLRHAYFEMVPGLQRYFITSGHDDFDSVAAQYGASNPSALRGLLHGLTTMPGMLSVILCGILGVLAGDITLLLTHDGGLAALIGVGGAVAFFVLASTIAMRTAATFSRRMASIFPPDAP
ncbi:MAG TPA: hypothetical protein VFP56_06440 [Candidatus Limnocylindrales bacterium]|nr:hypothetical protein [Candidatus Limnocylindrales bacterium]